MSDDLSIRSGLLLVRVCWSFDELSQWLSTLVTMRVLRCMSPKKSEGRCDNPATAIFWVDAAEWFPCCKEHWPSEQQWTRSTPFTPHVVSLPVIPDRAQAWLESLASDERAKIGAVGYIREG
jgi:hypothetical protein